MESQAKLISAYGGQHFNITGIDYHRKENMDVHTSSFPNLGQAMGIAVIRTPAFSSNLWSRLAEH